VSLICVGKLKRVKPFYKDQFEFLKKLVAPDEVKNLKLTICSPEWFHLRYGDNAFDHSVYPNDGTKHPLSKNSILNRYDRCILRRHYPGV
jgi:hypothetical protein